MPISAIDAITPAFEHTKQQLFQPFRMGQWAKLALVGLLAGEITTGSCGHLNNFHLPKHPDHSAVTLPSINPVMLAMLIAIVIVLGFAFSMLLLYLNSIMRFILFDSVVTKRCELGQQWNRRQGAALKYFLWQISFILVTVLGLSVLIAFPAMFAFAAGWLTKPKQHLAPLILSGMAMSLVILAFLLVCAVVQVLTKDFVIPQMALENLDAFEAWHRLLPMLGAEKGPYFGYLLMKIVMAIAAGILLAIVATIAVLIVLIPIGGVGALAVLAGKAVGLQWDVYTITLAVVVGSIVLVVFSYLIALAAVPIAVFFPAYSIYFLASRYPGLAMALHPAAPSPPPSQTAVPPPIFPLPETSS